MLVSWKRNNFMEVGNKKKYKTTEHIKKIDEAWKVVKKKKEKKKFYSQLRFHFHSPPVSATYQSHRLSVPPQLKAKVQLRMGSETSQFVIIWYLKGASCHGDGPSGSRQCVRGVMGCHRKRFGSVMTSVRRACLLYSQRWCERDETEAGWRGKEEREQRRVDSQLEW